MKNSVRAFSLSLLAVGTLAVASPAQAQTGIHIGGGLTFATFEGDDAEDFYDSHTGFLVGASIGFPLGDIITLMPGLYYVQKGANFEDDDVDGSTDLDYLEIPILLSVSVTGTQRPFGLHLFAGPTVAFNVGCSIEIDSASADCDDIDDIGAKSTDFGLMAGAGVTFGRFFVNGGLDVGLSSFDDSDDDEDIKNSTYFVMGGISIPLGM